MGSNLPAGLVQCDRLPEPIFTPTTKAEAGHDENTTLDAIAHKIGHARANELRERSLEIYRQAATYALERGIIIADTKFEFGMVGDHLILIDEVLTPDSSRFWDAEAYEPGRAQHSFDKQFVREWLLASDWDRNSPPPRLPDDIVAKTRAKYSEALARLTGRNDF